jgi:penicillin-binding protein 1A
MVDVDDGGHVRALVGGQDFRKSSVDLALGAAGGGSGRQAGSTFKAFMLAAVIKEGFTVQSVFSAPPKVILPHGNANGAPWIVTNFEDEHVAPRMNLVDATALSVNTVYAQVVAKLGAAKLDAMAEAMGIRPSELAGAYPSQVLGTADVSPLEMAAAYSTLANGGVYHTPVLITKVTRANGSLLPLPVAQTTRKVLTPAQAAVETFVLQQVVQRGTGVAAGGVGSAVAGKTGTTERSTDAWFVGYTPKLTAAMWMGYADSARSMDGFRGLSQVTGGTIPAELWHSFMAEALKSFPQDGGGFPTPDLAGPPLVPLPLSNGVVGLRDPVPTTKPPTKPSRPARPTTPPTRSSPTGTATPSNKPAPPGPVPNTASPTTRPPATTTTSTTVPGTTTTSTTVPSSGTIG